MPYKIIKRKCKQSSGKKGKYIIVKKSDNKKQSCHTSKEKAQSAVRARYANESEIREYIRSLLESSQRKSPTPFDDFLEDAIRRAKKLEQQHKNDNNSESNKYKDAVEEFQRLLGGR